MYELGLALSDLSLHGNGREMVMAGLQHTSRYIRGLNLFIQVQSLSSVKSKFFLD